MATYHDTPEQAVAAYVRYQRGPRPKGQPFPVMGPGQTVPDYGVYLNVEVPADGYTVAVSDDGLSAVLRSGAFELDAVKEEGEWRLILIRICGDYTPRGGGGLPVPTYQPSPAASPNP